MRLALAYLSVLVLLPALQPQAQAQFSYLDSLKATWELRVKGGEINLWPMYGARVGIKKTDGQRNADRAFRQQVLEHSTLDEAAEGLEERAWAYYTKGVLDTAMFRFNQAWLFKPQSIGPVWGMGLIMEQLEYYDESIAILDSASKLAYNDVLYTDLANSYLSRYYAEQDSSDLQQAATVLKLVNEQSPNVPRARYLYALVLYQQGAYAQAWAQVHATAEFGGEYMITARFIDDLSAKMADPFGVYRPTPDDN